MPLQNENSETFNHTPTKEELLSKYNENESLDPSSINYKRKIIRPKLHLFRVIIYCLLAIIFSSLVGFIFYFVSKNVIYSVISSTIILILTAILFIKQIIIWFIKVYQRFAPEKIRMRCRFEPSCSDYMILALNKYGLFKGLKKGILRLRRCKPPYGGYDEP